MKKATNYDANAPYPFKYTNDKGEYRYAGYTLTMNEAATIYLRHWADLKARQDIWNEPCKESTLHMMHVVEKYTGVEISFEDAWGEIETWKVFYRGDEYAQLLIDHN